MAQLTNKDLQSSYSSAYANFKPQINQTYAPSLEGGSLKTASLNSKLDGDEWKPKFSRDSIFYEPEPSTISDVVSTMESVSAKPSKNSIFFEDFSISSPGSVVCDKVPSPADAEPKSRNSIFDQDFATQPTSTTRSISAPPHSTVYPILDYKSPPKLKTVQHSESPRKQMVDANQIKSPGDKQQTMPSLEVVRNSIDKKIILQYVPLEKNLLGGSPNSEQSVCAIKVLHAGDFDAQSNGIVEAFMYRMIRDWKRGRGKDYILRLINIVEEGKQKDGAKNLVLALEFCPNGTLFDYVRNNPSICGRRRWINWCKQIAAAVAFLHAGHAQKDSQELQSIIHHDIKPHNILLDTRLDIRLSDFGCASLVERTVDDDRIPVFSDGLGRGTQAYSPPEILQPPEHQYSFATDIYALGCTFYFLLTGREPFGDLRNPAHQLWSIRRGFWESGANPIASSLINNNLMSETTIKSISLPPNVIQQPRDTGILKFINGETLHHDVDNDKLACEKIIKLLKQCTLVDPAGRPSADEVLSELALIDDLLILGTGFDDPESRSRSSSIERGNGMNRVPLLTLTMTPQQSDVVVERIPGGRRAFYL